MGSGMKFTSLQFEKRKKADFLAIPFWQAENKPVPAGKEKFDSSLLLPIQEGDFKGKEGEIALVYHEKMPEKRIVLLGLGPKEKASAETLRRAYACLGKFCLSKKKQRLNLVLPGIDALSQDDLIRGVAEGLLHVNYVFSVHKGESIKNDPPVLLEEVGLIGASSATLKHAAKFCGIFEGVNLTKTLVNSNADLVTPQYLAKLAVQLGKTYPAVKTVVLTKNQIEKEGMGLLLAVNQGSARDPAFIVMQYKGLPRSKDHTVIVGKGITFDTGGLNLKPTGSMETMKCDMAGAAAGFGVIVAAAAIGLKANFTVVVPSTENMIGSRSFKPGDVIKSARGRTVEVDNTDAEGRLVLADAFEYANKHLSPTRMIDLSTLTGGIVIALGEEVTGLMGNDQALVDALKHAGQATYERVWQMPLYDEYKEMLKSDIADIKNAGGRQGSSITAAIFLKEFVDQTPWAHLDIAGTAYLSKDRRYLSKYATGVGVRLLIEFLESQM